MAPLLENVTGSARSGTAAAAALTHQARALRMLNGEAEYATMEAQVPRANCWMATAELWAMVATVAALNPKANAVPLAALAGRAHREAEHADLFPMHAQRCAERADALVGEGQELAAGMCWGLQ